MELVKKITKTKAKVSYHKKPTVAAHYLDNMSTALGILNSEGFNTDSIRPNSIVDGDVKAILGDIGSRQRA